MFSINGVTVRLGGRTILDRASAAIPPRARVGLVGRNGAGKSTLMKVVLGQIDPDDGSIAMPKLARMGSVAQEAPAGTASPFETVLAADTERDALLAEEAGACPETRLAEIHDRLLAIDAYGAPAKASRILAGLGFDETMQHRSLSSFSGGWRMRVALAALLFAEPDVMLLDEPSNHLDLESTLWLESHLRSLRSTMLIVSHERDLLNNVVDHILHLQNGELVLYPGGYDAFEKQRRERQAQLESARAGQIVQREKLKEFIAKNSARASTAKQAQSRVKALARMQPIAEMADDPSLVFDFPSPAELKPPLIQLDRAAVGYDGKAILHDIGLRLDPDDRVALLGRNGEGKTTLARLLAGQLPAMEGEVSHPGKLRVGYFTQYQVEELDGDDTPLAHMSRMMPKAAQGAVRGQLGRFGFTGDTALQRVGSMSGGERARLALALVTRDAPHLLILDEPTNHLDVDAREALVQALAQFGGAVVVVSHDRHMLEATADRLVLVEGGRALEYDGSLDDYTDRVLGKTSYGTGSGDRASKASKKDDRKAAAAAREASAGLRKAVKDAEAETAKLTARRSEIDRALFDPASATGSDAKMTSRDLMILRADVERALAKAEVKWVEASEALEGV